MTKLMYFDGNVWQKLGMLCYFIIALLLLLITSLLYQYFNAPSIPLQCIPNLLNLTKETTLIKKIKIV